MEPKKKNLIVPWFGLVWSFLALFAGMVPKILAGVNPLPFATAYATGSSIAMLIMLVVFVWCARTITRASGSKGDAVAPTREGEAPIYPVYVLAKDDFSFHQFNSQAYRDWCEQPDIEDGIYEGWDSMGRHFSLTWNTERRKPAIVLSTEQDTSSFLRAALEYQRCYAGRDRLAVDPDAIVRLAANFASSEAGS